MNQSIYGFAGADTESIPRMEKMLTGCEVLKLTETRRCGKSIVREAQRFVSDFRAHESNPEGLVRNQTLAKYSEEVQDGDMVLCRVNAPLVSQALRLLKSGRKAVIRGRDFGGSLVNFINRLKAKDIPDLLNKVDIWYENESRKEYRRQNSSEARLMALQDRKDCVEAFCDGDSTIEEVTAKIQLVFAGKECPRCRRHYKEDADRCFNPACKKEKDLVTGYPCGPKLVTPKGVLFSSVHRAKGLESDRCFILMPEGAKMPHPMAKSAWQREQERHCLYIAVTRAKSELVYVT